ncbi:hypothetical protein T484DRAFT_3541088 [Baffinella frigidus]|nr:hypothetical protein T484DRAFT_3541088 [Cryptophyta sp. CCMP2293]
MGANVLNLEAYGFYSADLDLNKALGDTAIADFASACAPEVEAHGACQNAGVLSPNGCRPKLQTLHSRPSTLNPKHLTPNPTPKKGGVLSPNGCRPNLQTLLSRPSTRNPKHLTQNPNPQNVWVLSLNGCALTSKPYTLDPVPSTQNT